MKPTAELRAALSDTNAQAWLRVIRHGESHAGDASAYMALYGWTLGDNSKICPDLSKHPRVYTRLPDGRKTSAFGAYQIVYTTWHALRQRRPGVYTSMEAAMQDLAALDLTDGRRALDDVLAGRLTQACIKCRPEWTSLPGAAESRMTMREAARVFELYDGVLADDQSIV